MLTPGVEALVAGHDLVGVVLEKNIFNYRKYSERNPREIRKLKRKSGKLHRYPETTKNSEKICKLLEEIWKIHKNLLKFQKKSRKSKKNLKILCKIWKKSRII